MSIKKEKRDILDTIDFEGNLEMTLIELQNVMANHRKNGYIKFFIEKETEYDYGCPEGYTTHCLYGVRLETDEEFSKRIADRERRSKAAKKASKTKAANIEQKEIELYKKLHTKYQGKL